MRDLIAARLEGELADGKAKIKRLEQTCAEFLRQHAADRHEILATKKELVDMYGRAAARGTALLKTTEALAAATEQLADAREVLGKLAEQGNPLAVAFQTRVVVRAAGATS